MIFGACGLSGKTVLSAIFWHFTMVTFGLRVASVFYFLKLHVQPNILGGGVIISQDCSIVLKKKGKEK